LKSIPELHDELEGAAHGQVPGYGGYAAFGG
jgi:hypothetical protein